MYCTYLGVTEGEQHAVAAVKLAHNRSHTADAGHLAVQLVRPQMHQGLLISLIAPLAQRTVLRAPPEPRSRTSNSCKQSSRASTAWQTSRPRCAGHCQLDAGASGASTAQRQSVAPCSAPLGGTSRSCTAYAITAPGSEIERMPDRRVGDRRHIIIGRANWPKFSNTADQTVLTMVPASRRRSITLVPGI